METHIEKIKRLKKENDAVIMAHYYVPDEVQDIADYIGDSYFLADMATKVKEQTIVLCGVKFMAESAKVLNPNKKILLPEKEALCPMAEMATVEKIEEVREKYDDVAVVCYVNSTSELKEHSDVCVTSSNAEKIVNKLPNKNIYFIPDKNLGSYIAGQLKDKNIILNDGYCHVHDNITVENVKVAKAARPEALVLVHPECKSEVVALADYVGSTSGIIDFASKSDCNEFIISTELGVFHELKKRNPNKVFYSAGSVQICPNMKKITIEKVIDALENSKYEIEISDEHIEKAKKPLELMLELSK